MNPRMLACLLATLIFISQSPTLGQVEVQKDISDQQMWTDAMYYLKIGRMEYGKAYLQAYLERKVDPVKTLEFSEADPRSVQILIKLQSDPQLGTLAQGALDQIDKGWQAKRRDVKRIDGEVDRLTGTARAQFQATERLKEAGEYAVPVMLEYLGNAERTALHAKIIDALVALGPSAVEPLLGAVLELPEPQQLMVINTLGRLDYPQANPYLKQLMADGKKSSAVRNTAGQALESILSRNPKYRTDAGPAQAYYQLALRYYYHDSAVRPANDSGKSVGLSADIAADQPNLWLLKDGKLVFQPVPWEIYYELMTMRLTRRSLELDSSAGPRSALTLWLMANCKRESKLSATVNDPIHGKEFPTAQYFFRCSGTRYGLEALARSLQDGDNVIALAALESLREVASGNDILGVGGDHQPIVDALNHRRQLIRLYAALALGWSAPKDVYPGMDGVVPLLGQALLGARPASVVLMVPDAQKRTALAAQAKGLGLEVKAADGFEAAIKLLDKSAEDVELVIIDYALSAPSADQAVARVREHPLLRAVPVVVLASKEKLPDATTVLAKQAGVAVLPDGVGADVVAAKVAYLRQQMGRVALTKNDNTRNALLAAVALERLAWLNLKTYNVQQAGDSLVKSVYGSDWTLAAQCAKVLALLSAEPAQQSLAQAGIDRKDMDQKVYLLNLLADSVRRSGNRLTAKQIGQLQTLAVEEANPAVRQATGNVLGAMNLEPQVARKVILAREPFGAVK